MRSIIDRYSLSKIDYVEVVDAYTLTKVKRIERDVLVAVAVFIGNTRLIDNMLVKVKNGRVVIQL